MFYSKLVCIIFKTSFEMIENASQKQVINAMICL